MRVVILTSVRAGLASRCLPALCNSTAIDVAGVVLAGPGAPAKRRHLARKLRKMMQIGPLGAINGIRMRAWYHDSGARDIESVAAAYGVPVWETSGVNTDETRSRLREAEADLGLSLGNPYIAPSVFSIPRLGMVNVHTELLPEYQGAQSVIWPIHEGQSETGFSIHRIDRTIDTGELLLVRRMPILFGDSLAETVRRTVAATMEAVPAGLVEVCENYEALKSAAVAQPRMKPFTTPTFGQFLRMELRHRQMRSRAAPAEAGEASEDRRKRAM